MSLFDRAKSVGLSHVRTWLPLGRLEGAEWVCLNPTRSDNKEGSFKVNLETGKWNDWADSEAGNDVVSLYAYLHRDRLATIGNYKNREGGIQTEAAKEILENHDPSYFPSDKDDFTPPKTEDDPWAGYTQVGRGLPDSPDIMPTLKYFVKMWGDFFKHWTFTDKKGQPLFIVARYYKDGKKDDRPFSLYTNGTEMKWRSKNLVDVELPLYNLPEFALRQNDPILMTEGQKNAEDLKQVIGDKYICTAYFKGIKHTNIECLRGRTVYYWTDPDDAGRKKLKQVQDALRAIDCDVIVVKSPTGKPQGWDGSDAIKEGWTKDQILELIEKPAATEMFLDDVNSYPFRIIGQTATDLYFFTKETCVVMKVKKSSIGKSTLMTIMDRDLWGDSFADPKGGIAWDAATNFILRKGALSPIFDESSVRGTGAWNDNGHLVINTGKELLINGELSPLFQDETRFVYEQKGKVPYTIKNPLTVEQARGLIEITDCLDFINPEYSTLLAGWIMLAPFGGALDWRPHAWLTGDRGAGKTHIMDHIIYPMVSKYGLKALGSSSSAGLRQGLNNCSKPVMLDEAEADTLKKQEVIEDVLSMARQASSGSEDSANIMHGTQDGSGRNWIVKSMFLFASIGPAIKHGADKSRVTLLKLTTPRKANKESRAKNFLKLKEAERVLTAPWIEGFHARTLNLFPELLKCITIFNEQTADIMGTRRDGDQYGTLLAGAYMVTHDTAPTAGEARLWLDKFTLLHNDEPNEKDDGELCLDEIMNYKVQVSEYKLSIGIWLKAWFSPYSDLIDREDVEGLLTIAPGSIKRELEDQGIKPVFRAGIIEVQIADGHPAIQRILKSTAWVDTYSDIIERVGFCTGSGGPASFGALKKRFKRFKIEGLIVDGVPF